MKNIICDHFLTMDELNEHIKILEDRYQTKLNIINLSSTKGGYDMFYTI